MMPFSQIKRYYFNICGIFFLVLFVLTLVRSGGKLTLGLLFGMVVGWLVLCAAVIGVIYLVVVKSNKRKRSESDAAASGAVEITDGKESGDNGVDGRNV